jgi:putative DNA primase/helicase
VIDSAAIERARAVPVEAELERRGNRLRGRKQLAGPCPKCGGTDRFSVNTRKMLWHCRGCSKGGDVIALVRHLDDSSFAAAIETLTGAQRPHRVSEPKRSISSPSADEAAQARKAGWLWSQRVPATPDTPVVKYLRKRGYTGPIPPTIGWLPPRGSHGDAMIAAFSIATEIEPGIISPPTAVTGVHITRLTPDGVKNPDADGVAKITLGPSIGQPIVISPPNDLLGLAIAEGLETGLSVYQATGLGVWVAGSAGRMPTIADVVPNYIECVTVYQESDTAGQRGAEELAQRLAARGIEIFMTERTQ